MKPNKMKQTDKQMADEILGKLFIGIEKVRELSDLKALRFTDWTSMYCERDNADEKQCLWYICADDEQTYTTAELYNSTEFAEWLKQIEK